MTLQEVTPHMMRSRCPFHGPTAVSHTFMARHNKITGTERQWRINVVTMRWRSVLNIWPSPNPDTLLTLTFQSINISFPLQDVNRHTLHLLYVYTEIFVACLEILMLICWLVLFVFSFCLSYWHHRKTSLTQLRSHLIGRQVSVISNLRDHHQI